VSIVPTKRRRFFWAAWWSAPPEAEPFRKPDASSGGARSREEAHAAAERAAGQTLTEVESRWAGAWVRVLRGDRAWPRARSGEATRAAEPRRVDPPKGSRPWAYSLLGLTTSATVTEIKRAFRALALRAHPDRGGDDAAFIDAKRAHDIALAAAESPRRRRRR
jgi:hypothetical protein